jgi:hypothetical protein
MEMHPATHWSKMMEKGKWKMRSVPISSINQPIDRFVPLAANHPVV